MILPVQHETRVGVVFDVITFDKVFYVVHWCVVTVYQLYASHLHDVDLEGMINGDRKIKIEI